MSTGTHSSQNSPWREDRPSTAWAEGIALFGGVTLGTLGVLQFIQGLVAALNDDVYVNTPNYVLKFDLTAWGWIHMIIGAIAVVVGVLIIAEKRWGYALGIAVAVVSAVGSFAFLPYYPWWSVIVLIFDVVVIWALSTVMSRTQTSAY